jgi:hypothetical protein
MSLGCGPQAGNITSDNITVKHLLNIKRAAFLRRDWDEVEKRDHAWAAKFTRDSAPRGSGLPGDPAIAAANPRASSSAFDAPAGSNWQGNPAAASSPRAASTPPAPARMPLSTMGRAPASFTNPSGAVSGGSARTQPVADSRPSTPMASKVQAAPKSPAGSPASGTTATMERVAQSMLANSPRASAPSSNSAPRASVIPNTSYVGAGLSVDEIQNIMSHAGAGCPLGPCKGCPHHDVSSGACMA